MERKTGIEPAEIPAWKAGALPLGHFRVSGAGGRARNDNTPEPKSGRFPLTPLPHILDTFYSLALPTELLRAHAKVGIEPTTQG